MEGFFRKFERAIVLFLLALMMVTVLATTAQLTLVLVRQLIKPPIFMLTLTEMLELLGFFLMVMIGLELLESIKAYLDKSRTHAEVVFLVAIVAVARKVIIVDYKDTTPEMLYGMSAVIVALGVGYYLVRRALHTPAGTATATPVLPTAAGESAKS